MRGPIGNGNRALVRLLMLEGGLGVAEMDGGRTTKFISEPVSCDDAPPLVLVARGISFSFEIVLRYGGGAMNEGVNNGDELTDDGGNGLLGGVGGGGGETEGKNEVPAT